MDVSSEAGRLPYILLVEDDEDIQEIFGEILRSRGHVIVVATTGAEAWTMLRSAHPPAALILDRWLPDMTADDILAKLRDDVALASIGVTVITGTSGPPPELGENVLWLHKPIELSQLTAAVDAMLPGSSSIRD